MATFTSNELFVIDGFVAKHAGKSWVTIKHTDASIFITVSGGDKYRDKKIKIDKKDTESFHVTIVSRDMVLCHIDWIDALVTLLMRVEIEMFNESLLEAK